MTLSNTSGFVPGAIVEFTLPDDPGHPQGEKGRIMFKDPNGDLHILWETAAPKLPRFTLHVFDRSGHTPQLEEPELFSRVLLEWIGQPDRARS